VRRGFGFALVLWFITAYPRLAKALVLLAALAILWALSAPAVKP
jgi:hypothetical protein